ncbi:MAG: rhomboid family intramembrane serine protease, partial [Acidobacteria bacterium]
SFGPGPVSPTIKALVWANVAMFVARWLAALAVDPIGGTDVLTYFLGLNPQDAVLGFHFWQPATYLFLHAGFFHILFNMLTLWMFGVELERLWGTRFFLKYYFVTGIGAGVATIFLAFLPLPGDMGASINQTLRTSITVGASGSIYGLLLAYALYFPDRPLYMFPIPIPIKAKYFVRILGGMALLSSMSGQQGGVANVAHLGGLVVGYFYLRMWRTRPMAEVKYRYFKWKMNRMRRKFDVYSGGKRDWDRNVH